MTRIIVCGSRRWNDRQAIADRLADVPTDSTIVHGGAHGADRIANQEAQKLGLLVEEHRPDYDLHGGKRAPLERNKHMASLGADLCLAFQKDGSTGTAHMIECARAAAIPVVVIYP